MFAVSFSNSKPFVIHAVLKFEVPRTFKKYFASGAVPTHTLAVPVPINNSQSPSFCKIICPFVLPNLLFLNSNVPILSLTLNVYSDAADGLTMSLPVPFTYKSPIKSNLMALLITSNDEVPANDKKYNGLGYAPIPTLAVDAVPI